MGEEFKNMGDQLKINILLRGTDTRHLEENDDLYGDEVLTVTRRIKHMTKCWELHQKQYKTKHLHLLHENHNLHRADRQSLPVIGSVVLTA